MPEMINEIIEISLNGKKEKIQKNSTIQTILDSKQINPRVVACELNLSIIKRDQLGSTPLKDGDNLEIIRMIGGG